jgi:hypothetical protein
MTREKERARLDVRPGKMTVGNADELIYLEATIEMRNIGANRAFIGNNYGKIILKDTEVPFEKWEDDINPLHLPDNFLDPSVSPIGIRFHFFLTETGIDIQGLAEALEQRRKSLHLSGFIEYETLGLRWRREFGYDWIAIGPRSMIAMFGGADPVEEPASRTAAERIAHGYWSPHRDRDRPEYPIGKDEPYNPN